MSNCNNSYLVWKGNLFCLGKWHISQTFLLLWEISRYKCVMCVTRVIKKPHIRFVTYWTNNETKDTWLMRLNRWMIRIIENGGAQLVGSWTNVMYCWRNQICLLKLAHKMITLFLSETRSIGFLLIEMWSGIKLLGIIVMVLYELSDEEGLLILGRPCF